MGGCLDKDQPEAARPPPPPRPQRQQHPQEQQQQQQQRRGQTPPPRPPEQRRQLPDVVDVRVWGRGNASCQGRYQRCRDEWNGSPIWAAGAARLYTDGGGFWLIGAARDMRDGMAWFATQEPHGGRSPADPTLRWAYILEGGDGSWLNDAPIAVTDPQPQRAPRPLPPGDLTPDDALAVIYGANHEASVQDFQVGLGQVAVAAALGWPHGRGEQLFYLLSAASAPVPRARAQQYPVARRVFDLVDSRRAGVITAWDLHAALVHSQEVRSLLRVPPELAQSLLRQMDREGRGRVDSTAFARWFVFQREYILDAAKGRAEVVQRVIAKLSVPRRGGITLTQLEDVLSAEPHAQIELGWPASHAGVLWKVLAAGRRSVSEDELRSFLILMVLFNRIDRSRDGYIDAEEFGSALALDPALQADLRVTASDAQRHFRAIATQSSGVASFAEFYRYFKGRFNTQAEPPPEAPPLRHPRHTHPEDAYETQRILGEGCYGIVYLAIRKADGLRLIMKEPKVSEVDMEDVKREAELLRRLKHPNIIRFVDAFRHSRTRSVVIVTEYAAGGDLRRRIRQARGGLPTADALRWFGETCEGIGYLHDRYIVHRDIKPDNIFLTERGSVKVGDLGLGKQLGRGPRDQANYTHTILRGPRGLPSYMAPEQVQCRPHTVAIDVWALGCLLYEMATGRVAFGSPDAVLGPPPRDAPPYAVGIVARLLVDQTRRPNIHELIQMLTGPSWRPRDAGVMATYIAEGHREQRAHAGAVDVVTPFDAQMVHPEVQRWDPHQR
eukprot:TRINITY_DN6625_c0_g3_i1.p1 TRINITY_DN6625_c0_g3~~TRINITY_DN6625_c0_g3_i1.p1  ORF type:complete len:781 (+),score=269.17 TRINITY_DN6625_c0_g3_i1:39-2381(+)